MTTVETVGILDFDSKAEGAAFGFEMDPRIQPCHVSEVKAAPLRSKLDIHLGNPIDVHAN
ncbi:hypothetical protein K7472_25255 [Streptomyces sp. PTM05]|uniref:Uncharacterized protein n=1 Tax=Streptantibioticus parmotrematis TaxID=2873249 RepID=A0ABS7QYW2_9ACTN|nr:hypothetical protein [Streptantibioticus parmotrematis]MBY8888123.1 hypothetical protein [Streptantibioticus parmotrematis]